MLIIFVAHMPGNSWFNFIPARFGFSSAAELFVFCSGLASSFAFGRVFRKNGWLAGTRRILFRIWQVYWAHIGLALVLMTLSAFASQLTGTHYTDHLMLGWFFANVGAGLV
ncbi:MAG TPA: OpgC domain-containing protein, partial [Rhabdaerophilum sp.]|nr:OpgC domain-containing protein [Rhabdaerophilum sp.]